MSASIDYLPIWKKDSTAEEWFLEIAAVARKYPERFEKVCVIMQETLANGNTLDRNFSRGVRTTELLGMLELAKTDLIAFARR